MPFVDDPDLLARVRRCSWEVMRSIHDPRGGRSGRGDVLLGPVSWEQASASSAPHATCNGPAPGTWSIGPMLQSSVVDTRWRA
ncbi:hypothetical protein HMPREF0682_1060 [Propionibacterium acidifaciens F0233]|uniref:Uncharacterized protein n=1 Tax=Propionibacterium acidifaciens F0233 TaxID=553198 RepID=U2QQG1_9ACTN|nr:hypothetical protein HMPREF0682_1060 [Propionibacterium acidifaciens F0233]